MKNDIYGEPEIIKGIITEEERERRMNLIKQASVSLVLSQYERGQNVRKTTSNT